MLNLHSIRVSGTSTEVFFPNNMGASILRMQTPGQPEFMVAVIHGTETDWDVDLTNVLYTDEIGCNDMLEKIRNFCPD